MIRQLTAILFVFTFLLDIVHDIIPHHHIDQNVSEVIIHQYLTGTNYLDDTEEHQHSFPPHRHFYCGEDLNLSRLGNHYQIDIKKIFSELVLLSPLENKESHEPPGIENLPKNSVSLQNYPFICSPHGMRGSPFIS